jgi:hypothetical protein
LSSSCERSPDQPLRQGDVLRGSQTSRWFDGQLYSLRYAKGGLGWLSVLVDTVVFDNIDSDGKP